MRTRTHDGTDLVEREIAFCVYEYQYLIYTQRGYEFQKGQHVAERPVTHAGADIREFQDIGYRKVRSHIRFHGTIFHEKRDKLGDMTVDIGQFTQNILVSGMKLFNTLIKLIQKRFDQTGISEMVENGKRGRSKIETFEIFHYRKIVFRPAFRRADITSKQIPIVALNGQSDAVFELYFGIFHIVQDEFHNITTLSVTARSRPQYSPTRYSADAN